jgi:hypothetical protein
LDVIAWYYGVTWLLALLDFSEHLEAKAKLRTRQSAKALAYAMSHDVWQMGAAGHRTTPWMCMLCGNMFGNAEAGTSLVAFSQSDIDITLVSTQAITPPQLVLVPGASLTKRCFISIFAMSFCDRRAGPHTTR